MLAVDGRNSFYRGVLGRVHAGNFKPDLDVLAQMLEAL